MSKKSLINRNSKRIQLYKKYTTIRNKLKKEIMNKDISIQLRFKLIQELASLPLNSCKTRIVNRCVITGRSRGFSCFYKFPITRVKFRELAYAGHLPGMRKSSW